MIGGKTLTQIEIDLRAYPGDSVKTIYIDIFDNSLSKKWLGSFTKLLADGYHLEKNYCFFGFERCPRHAAYICDQINRSIAAINQADIGYQIDNHFTVENTITKGKIGNGDPGGYIDHDKFNWLHRYFEDLQGVSGAMSPFYEKADAVTRWHIRQLNLLCHEYESLVLSMRKATAAPDWRRPSQLMCWLHAPRFTLEPEDYELFGIETINRPLGGVFVGVNKAVGKHHWEVFNDEGRDSRVGELVSTSMRAQTEAAGDFDIEWGNDPGDYPWQIEHLAAFRQWLIDNGFDPEDKSLTIGHPQIGQVDLLKSFGTKDHNAIWNTLTEHLDVYKIRCGSIEAVYDYHWSDSDFVDQQVKIIQRGH